MGNDRHARAHIIAGAIALGEATDRERVEYREHLAGCARCVEELGGEHSIERTAQVVARARESEIWEPDVSAALRRRMERRRPVPAMVFSAAAFCLLVALGLHAALAGRFAPLTSPAAPPVHAIARHAVAAAPRVAAVPVAVPQRRLVIEHHIVQISRIPDPPPIVPPVPARAKIVAAKRGTLAKKDTATHALPQSDGASNVPIWRRGGWTTVSKTTTSISEGPPHPMTPGETLTIAASYSTREAAPVGGETAIKPQPAGIAYDEGAQGTTVFAVSIDERGTPTKCAITKSSGYEVLDDAVCKAAMAIRYTPKTVDGRAVPGTYTDAFTFRLTTSAY